MESEAERVPCGKTSPKTNKTRKNVMILFDLVLDHASEVYTVTIALQLCVEEQELENGWLSARVFPQIGR